MYQQLFNKIKSKTKVQKSINTKRSFILVSYYWGEDIINNGSIYNLTYGQQVKRLIKDCKKVNVNYYFVRYPALENKKVKYQDALGLKPYFIKDCLKRFPQYKCIFIDTDLRLLTYPHLFDIDADCWFLNWSNMDFECYNPYQLELSGAVLGFANTLNSHKLLDILIKEYNPKYAEDKSFSGIITRNFLNIGTRCVWLPDTYLYMFQNHEYTPNKGYTRIINYNQELKNSHLNKRDLVFVHEDFETGALDDIYDQKVGKDRYPPKLDKQFGEKLRCITAKFVFYKNWYMNKKEYNHYRLLLQEQKDEKIITLKTLPKVPKKNIKIIEEKNYKSKYIIIYNINQQEDNLDKIRRYCAKKKLSYKIIDAENIPLILYNLLKTKPLLYLTNVPNKIQESILKTDNMDFMTTNINNTFDCYDPRILKTLDTNLIYINNHEFTKKFLAIWYEYNTSLFIKSQLQHKSLEYAFNITNAVNILRCYWIPFKKKHSIIKTIKKSIFGKIDMLRKSLEQCGLKPPRGGDLEPKASHKYGSKPVKQPRAKYLEWFL